MQERRPRLEGKVAFISGGARGMGACEGELFAAEGARVVLGDVLEEQGRAVEARIRAAGGEALFVKLDVTSEGSWRDAIAATVSSYGRLDVLVNNAGIGSGPAPSTVEDTDGDRWDQIMDVNSTGVFLGTKYAIPEMRRAGGGSIINISSIFGLVGSPGSTPYHASKGAVRLLTKATTVQYAGDGIRANSVHPGFVETPMTEAQFRQPGGRQRRIDSTPLGRIGTPLDIAYGVLYLASDESSFVTGSELVIDGGYTAQ
ncbi:MAG: glucose 1-dehydrogenase [Dehalococcoidia bacterium]|nr:glucose 1-dehydrogenase [Dehalococcoidia bacterium]